MPAVAHNLQFDIVASGEGDASPIPRAESLSTMLHWIEGSSLCLLFFASFSYLPTYSHTHPPNHPPTHSPLAHLPSIRPSVSSSLRPSVCPSIHFPFLFLVCLSFSLSLFISSFFLPLMPFSYSVKSILKNIIQSLVGIIYQTFLMQIVNNFDIIGEIRYQSSCIASDFYFDVIAVISRGDIVTHSVSIFPLSPTTALCSPVTKSHILP